MDEWLLMCMLTVGLAIFEYAVCLATLFGKQRNNINEMKDQHQKAAVATQRCRKIDCYALRLFIVVYNLFVAIYLYIHAA